MFHGLYYKYKIHIKSNLKTLNYLFSLYLMLQLDEYHDLPQDGSDEFNDEDDEEDDDDDDRPPVAAPTRRLGGKSFRMQVMDD